MRVYHNGVKKRLALLLALAMLALSLCGCGKAGPIDEGFWQQPSQHSYRAELSLDEAAKAVSGRMTVTYKNPTGAALASLPFMLYPNAYAQVQTAPFQNDEMGKAYPGGFSEGGIVLTEVTADGQPVQTRLKNDDETLLEIDLPQPLAADGTAEVSFAFTVQLPHCLGRFGYGDSTYNLCNFLPVACAWDGTQFLTHPYGAVGDPFVSDASDYSVSLSVPEGMVAAYTGTAEKEPVTENGRTTYSIRAAHARDFAAVVSRDFAVETTHVNSGGQRVTVRSFYDADCPEGGRLAANTAKQALRVFGEMYGPYPYGEFNAVQTDFFIGGMEYPGLVLLDRSLYTGQGLADLERVTAHETAHQWWYAVVGNDQAIEPWLDEALTDYSTLLYMGRVHGQAAEQDFYDTYVSMLSEVMGPMYNRASYNVTVGSPAADFPNNQVYSLVVYTEGTMMLRDVENLIGRDAMIRGLAAYYQKYAGKLANGENLIQTLEESAGQNVRMAFDECL